MQTYNAAGVSGLAGTVLDLLARKGFQRGGAHTGTYSDTTAVRYAEGERASAEAVVVALGGNARAVEDDSVPGGQVHVHVGADYSPPDSSDPASADGTRTAVAPTTGLTPPITADGVVCVN